MNDYNQLKIINIDPTRNIYFNKGYNNLFNNNIQSIFENESKYILQYFDGGKAIVSYGNINQLNGFYINHSSFLILDQMELRY